MRNRLVGESLDVQCQGLLMSLARRALDTARHLRETSCHDRDAIVEHEHLGDATERQIHEILDKAFIMRFDKADMTRLAWEIDETIDGMRKIATHVEVHKAHLQVLPESALELLACIEEMAGKVLELTVILTRSRVDLSLVKQCAAALESAETRADELHFVAESELAAHYNKADASPVEYQAWLRLYNLLEKVTDHANHCGSHVLSMARREA